MQSKRIMAGLVHIVPRMPPMVDGVGDYAINLAKCLFNYCGISSRFIVADPAWPESEQCNGFPAHKLKSINSIELSDCLKSYSGNVFLLHYVGYGFNTRGVPGWLLEGLNQCGGLRLITFFHEIWATGKPWSSAFWLHPMQRYLVHQIAKLSDRVLTSNRRMAMLIGGNVCTLPIPSNLAAVAVPQIACPGIPPWRVVLFGKVPNRIQNIKANTGFLRKLHENNLLKYVEITGECSNTFPNPSEDVACLVKILPSNMIRVQQNSSPERIMNSFGQSDFSVWHYPGSLLTKSTVFMTSISCGCPVILPTIDSNGELEAGRHYMVCNGKAQSLDTFIHESKSGKLNMVGETARQWYLKNADWSVITKKFGNLLAPLLEKGE